MTTTAVSRRVSNPISFADITAALGQGIADFKRAPVQGLFFGGIYALGGLALILLLTYYRSIWLILPLALGFPLIGPFVAAGLYEVSRRMAAHEPLKWGEILSVIFRQSQREMGWMAFTVLFIFWVWIYQVRLLLALFAGYAAFSSIEGAMAVFSSPSGVTVLVVGTIVGAILSFVLFATTVVAMPMLLDRNVDFITAMITSWR
ncbi:MAG: DUF2189 domain-containing protein, partial [Hyphomicrobiales bacterium]